MRKSGWSVACDQSIQLSTRARSAGSADHKPLRSYRAAKYLRMAWDSHTARSPSSITGTRPCGFNARNDGSSSPPKPPPAGVEDEPKHFLHMEGVAASPNFEHGRPLLIAGP